MDAAELGAYPDRMTLRHGARPATSSPSRGNGGQIGASIGGRGRFDGLLPCACWCGRGIVLVTKADVHAGVTGSCGQDRCATLDQLEDARRKGRD